MMEPTGTSTATLLWRGFLCWLLWHRHSDDTDTFNTYCLRCGEHIEEHYL